MCAAEDCTLGRAVQGPGDGGQEPVPASHELCEAMLKRPLTRAECVTIIAALQGLPREDLSPPELAILAAAEAEALKGDAATRRRGDTATRTGAPSPQPPTPDPGTGGAQ
jgi:hypothetical protein